MPSMMPPQFSMTADGDRQNKDGHFTNKKENFEGPLAAKGEGDSNAFSENDVTQGNLEDCWFLASVAAIAKTNPDLLERNIKDLGEGKYEVTLYQRDPKTPNGPLNPQVITVNNAFQIGKHSGTAIAAKPGDNEEIWVMLIEKAYAKMNGGYQVLKNRGYSEVALEALTGKPHSEITISGKKGTEKQAQKRFDRQMRSFDRKNPGATDRDREKFGPKMEGLFGLSEWEIIPKLAQLLNDGCAVTLGTDEIRNQYVIEDGFKIMGPHVYALVSVNEDAQTACLYDPNGKFPLENLPVKYLRKYFTSIDYVKAE